jgi:hypothetical protein
MESHNIHQIVKEKKDYLNIDKSNLSEINNCNLDN